MSVMAQPIAFFALYAARDATYHLPQHGASPSGKATDFDSVIRRFDPSRPSHQLRSGRIHPGHPGRIPSGRIQGRDLHRAGQTDRQGQPIQPAHDALPDEHTTVFMQLQHEVEALNAQGRRLQQVQRACR